MPRCSCQRLEVARDHRKDHEADDHGHQRREQRDHDRTLVVPGDAGEKVAARYGDDDDPVEAGGIPQAGVGGFYLLLARHLEDD